MSNKNTSDKPETKEEREYRERIIAILNLLPDDSTVEDW